MTVAAPQDARPSFALALRFALREMRGGLKGFYVFIACIALGVAAIAGVASVSRALTEGIAGEGRTILGGDISFSVVHRELTDAERGFLDDQGRVSSIATMRAMARKSGGDDQALVEIKAIDDAYPLFGTLALTSGGDVHALTKTNGNGFDAVADAALLARLDLNVGDQISIGRLLVTIRDTIETEADKLAGGVDFGPRLMVSLDALRASGLLQPGSLVRWHHRLRLNGTATDADTGAETGAQTSDGMVSDARLERVIAQAREKFPQAGWRIRSRANAAPGLQRNINRFTQFLTLVGLTSLVVGGVGVANAVRAFLDSKREVIATFKCLGAPGHFVFTVYLAQITILAGAGILIGLVLGAIIPFAAGAGLAQVLPVQVINGIYPAELGLGLVYGLLAALAFALWPLGRAHDIPPSALFRDQPGEGKNWPRKRYILATAITVLALASLAVLLAYEKRIALIYVGASATSFVLLVFVGRAIMAVARRIPHVRTTEWRLAIANIHRPGALTPSVVLSLGLGLTLLVALALIDGNLRQQLGTTIAQKAPSFFFVDIQNSEKPGFDALLKREAPEAIRQGAPMLRGRLVKLKGVPTEDIDAPPSAAWVLRGDRGITYAENVPDNSKLIAGSWWGKDYTGEPLVSFEAQLAEELGLAIGDSVTVNVLGREITAKIANTRTVEWESLAINFVMVFSPNTFAGAPHSHLATVTWQEPVTTQREITLLKAVTAAFPTVTGVRVKDAIQQVNDLVAQLAWAIRAASSITLIASILVLAGALAAGHRSRIHDAVILKTLGATRRRLIAAYAIEYAILGLATALFGVIAGSLAAWFVVAELMDATFTFQPAAAASAALIALALSVGLGLVGTWRVLGEKPAPMLRNL